MYKLPSENRTFLQRNTGETSGNVYASYGIDLESNRGKLLTSESLLKAYTDADNADFSGYAAQIIQDGTSSVKTFAISDKAFSASDITGTWSEETVGTEPDSGNTIMDAVLFDGLLLVSEATDIKAWNGSTWSSWWQTTKGQSALTIGERHLLEVGPDNNLYIVDEGNKVYRVNGATGGVTKTGNGSLDFSDTNYELSTLDASATRMWISAVDKSGNDHAIIEWDMSPSASTANKIHRIGNAAARCIAIWNESPIALLENGRIIYYNGSAFVEWPGVRMPIERNTFLSEDFVHPNGWAIIDNLPHFLLTGRIAEGITTEQVKNSAWTFPAGVYCLDPEFGFYNRYPLVDENNIQQTTVVSVGALKGIKNTNAKFICSYEYYTADGSGTRSILAYHDKARTNGIRSFVITPLLTTLRSLYKTVELYHNQLVSGDSINVYYRTDSDDPIAVTGTYSDSTHMNVTGVSLGIVAGNMAFIKDGTEGGKWVKIKAVTESASVTVLEFAETLSVTAGHEAALEFLPFKFMGTIENTTKDMETFTIPDSVRKRKLQLLLVFDTASQIEVDNVIIDK